jgi:hypothetical protein
MPRRYLFFCLLVAAGLTACADYYSRTYRYRDEIPMSPFAVKLLRSELGMVDGRVTLRMILHLSNRSAERQSLAWGQFAIRIGRTREQSCDQGGSEPSAREAVSLEPGKETDVAVPVVVARPDLDQRLDLVLGWSDAKPRKHPMRTLIVVKKAGAPRSLPREGEWRVLDSENW